MDFIGRLRLYSGLFLDTKKHKELVPISLFPSMANPSSSYLTRGERNAKIKKILRRMTRQLEGTRHGIDYSSFVWKNKIQSNMNWKID